VTLLDPDSIVGANDLAQDGCVTQGGIKGLVTAALAVKDVLANDSPFLLDEGCLPEDLIRMS